MGGLSGLEHHVVGDVDHERHRADAREGQPGHHPRRGGPGCIHAAHGAGHEDCRAHTAADRRVVGDGHREPRRLGLEGLDHRDGVAEGRARGVGVLARDASDREGVPAVGRDVDLDGEVVQAEEGDRIRAHLGVEPEARKTKDAVVLVAETQLASRGDHAVGDVAVGLARGDREGTRQHGARQRDHDLVTDHEVVGAADDAARLGFADIHLAPVDRLAVGLRLGSELEHLPDDDGTRQLEAVHVLLFEPDLDERCVHVLVGDVLGEVDEFAEPGDGDAHLRPPFRTAARSAHRPRPCRACRSSRCGTAGCARCPCRTRSPDRPRDRCPRRAERWG